MGLDDVIGLDSSGGSRHKGEDNGLARPNLNSAGADCIPSTYQLKEEDISNGNSLETFADSEGQDNPHVHDMDLEDDSKQPILEKCIVLVESVMTVEKVHKIHCEETNDNGSPLLVGDTSANKLLVDKSPISGIKRSRTAYVDQEPCVRVVYNSLTSESKKKLMEVMQQWSQWHAKCKSPSNEPSNKALEYGEETYFPALHVGAEKTCAVTFWVDNLARKEDNQNMPLDNSSVPLYDRGYTLGSSSLGGSSVSERIETLEASRCFNCGSYSHSLRECPKPRDTAAINNARQQHNSKRNTTPGSRGPARYHQKSQGKFDNLKAGVLGPETRECLGIGELDPPPWLHRMRQLGYPPGYLDEVEDEGEPSGITIFGDEETTPECENGENPEKGDPAPPEKKMSVEFPGINVPIPENADHHRWGAAPSASVKNLSHHRPKSDGPPGAEYGSPPVLGYPSPDIHRGHHSGSSYRDSHRDGYPDHQRSNGLSGMEHGSGRSGSGSIYSPRYRPYDHNYPPPPIARSPILGRSLSDRGLPSPTGYEGSPLIHSPHSPYPYPIVAHQSPAPQYHSPSASLEQWAHGSTSAASSDLFSRRLAGRERQDHQHYHLRPHR